MASTCECFRGQSELSSPGDLVRQVENEEVLAAATTWA